MSDRENGQTELKDKIIQTFSDFMTRIAKFEEMVPVGSKFLVGFQQALGFLGQHSISKTSPWVERILKIHDSKRVSSYEEAGCVNNYDRQQNVSKLDTCYIGLRDYINKAKIIVDELSCLLDDAASTMQTVNKNDEDINNDSDSFINSNHEQEEIPISDHSKPGVADYVGMMTIVYSMVKQDYAMQDRIVSSLDFKTKLGALETYCLMWSLRPNVDNDIMHEAWSLVS